MTKDKYGLGSEESRAQSNVTRVSPAVRSTFVAGLPSGRWAAMSWQDRDAALQRWLASPEGRLAEQREREERVQRHKAASLPRCGSDDVTLSRSSQQAPSHREDDRAEWAGAVEAKAREWNELIEGENVSLRLRVSQLEQELRDAISRRRSQERRAAALLDELQEEKQRRAEAEQQAALLQERLAEAARAAEQRPPDSPPPRQPSRTDGEQRPVRRDSRESWRPSPPRGVGPASAGLAIPPRPVPGLEEENAALKKMLGYIRGQIRALDSIAPVEAAPERAGVAPERAAPRPEQVGLLDRPGLPPVPVSAPAPSAPVPPPLVAGITDWAPEMPSWADFLAKPRHSAFAVGTSPTSGGGGRAWGAAWGKATAQEAAAEALAACRMRGGDAVLVHPAQ